MAGTESDRALLDHRHHIGAHIHEHIETEVATYDQLRAAGIYGRKTNVCSVIHLFYD